MMYQRTHAPVCALLGGVGRAWRHILGASWALWEGAQRGTRESAGMGWHLPEGIFAATGGHDRKAVTGQPRS